MTAEYIFDPSADEAYPMPEYRVKSWTHFKGFRLSPYPLLRRTRNFRSGTGKILKRAANILATKNAFIHRQLHWREARRLIMVGPAPIVSLTPKITHS